MLWKENFEVGDNSMCHLLVSTRSLDTLPGGCSAMDAQNFERGKVQDHQISE